MIKNDINVITIDDTNDNNQIQPTRAHLLMPTRAHSTCEVEGVIEQSCQA